MKTRPSSIAPENRSPALQRYYARRQENRLAGLQAGGNPLKSQKLSDVYWSLRDGMGELTNSQGVPYRRTPVPPSLRLVARRARGLMAWHKRRQRLARLNLNSRGQARKYRFFEPKTDQHRAVRLKLEARERMARLRASRKAVKLTVWQDFRRGISVARSSWDDLVCGGNSESRI